jgi:TRAP-type mannitol/chloroaromatic compound transport system permease small subunit
MTTKVTRIVDAVDALSERVGRFASWLVLAVVLLGAWNAVARYVSRFTELQISSNAYLELQWYLFSAIFLLGGAYTLKRDEHVRVDVVHANMHPRRRAKIDIAGTILFLIPFCVFVLWTSWYPVVNSWKILERSPDPGGLVRYPVKTLIPVAFVLLLLQAIALLIRRIRFLRESSHD